MAVTDREYDDYRRAVCHANSDREEARTLARERQRAAYAASATVYSSDPDREGAYARCRVARRVADMARDVAYAAADHARDAAIRACLDRILDGRG